MSFRDAVAMGLVEIIKGELSGAPVLEAWDQIHVPAGEVWVAPLVSRVLEWTVSLDALPSDARVYP
jgi:hypothetical protein